MILMAHMTRLTQADEVAARVCRFGGIEKPERFDVVDGKALSHMNPTFGAVSGLICDNGSAGYKPAPAAICAGTANPIWGIRAFRFCRATAGNRAELSDTILPRHPRLLAEGPPAMATGQRDAIDPLVACLPANILRPEGIRGALPFAELVPKQVRLRPRVQKRSGLPRRAAGVTAKPSFRSPVGLDAVGGRADFTCLFDHAESIPETGNMGKRTTLVAIACKRVDEAARQPDLLIPATQAKPVQEGLDL